MDLKEYVIGKWDDQIANIEVNLSKFHTCPEGQCYYEFNKVGNK